MPDELTHSKKMLESLKLLKEWSTWLVTIQTGLLSFLATAKNLGVFVASDFFLATVICTALSILMGAWVLSSIPSVVRRVDDSRKYEDFRLYDVCCIPSWLTLNIVAITQHVFFFAGIISFVVLILCSV
jgi:hypothetical protein